MSLWLQSNMEFNNKESYYNNHVDLDPQPSEETNDAKSFGRMVERNEDVLVNKKSMQISAKDIESHDFFNESNRKTDYFIDQPNEKTDTFNNWWANIPKKESYREDNNYERKSDNFKNRIASSLSVDKIFNDRQSENKLFDVNNVYAFDNKLKINNFGDDSVIPKRSRSNIGESKVFSKNIGFSYPKNNNDCTAQLLKTGN